MRDIMKEARSNERGQIVVIVAFALVVLLLAAGLAIDGGTLLFNRRSMQNAADAAALAGTRELSQAMCDDTDANATDAAVSAAVEEFALRNGVESVDNIQATYVHFDNFNDVVQFSPPVAVGNGTVPNGASGVAVTTTITQSTYFMGLIGEATLQAGAAATAVTGPPFIVGGIRPFGVHINVIDSLGPGDCFSVDFKNCKNSTCWIKDDEGNELVPHRGWMNLGYVWREDDQDEGWPRAQDTSVGADDLKEWMCNGWDGSLWADCLWEEEGCENGDFIHADPGTTASGIGEMIHKCPEMMEGHNGSAGELIYIPVYDVVPDYDEISTNKPGSAGAGDSYYHIVGFGGIRIQEDGTDQGASVVRACVEEVIIGQGQPSPNTGYGTDVCATHTMVVTLWR